jgi:hypothetical protein
MFELSELRPEKNFRSRAENKLRANGKEKILMRTS